MQVLIQQFKKCENSLFLGLDQEGGPVLRVMNELHLPGAMALASSDRDVLEISKAVASDLKI